MVSRKDFCLETIYSIINAKKNEHIKIYLSIKENMYQEIKNKIKEDLKYINIIRYEKKYKCVFDHMKVLANHCISDYIMIVHDDDLIGKDFFINTYSNLIKYSPEALSTRTTFIDARGKELKKLRVKSIKKTYKISSTQILNRCFLPFKNGKTITPTIAFKTNIYKKYWLKNRNFIGLHEDAKINYYFALRGKFFESGITQNYAYRIHHNQVSSNKVSLDRKSLNKWLSQLKINIIYKSLLLICAQLQYLIYYKNINVKNKNIRDFLSKSRNDLHNYRSGFD